MQFQKGKPFRILQIADTQENDRVAADTLKLINAALDEVQPDLVVLTGDQIKGYSPRFLTGDYIEKVRQTLHALTEPMVRRGIAFAPTFGNHDAQGKVKKAEQLRLYAEQPGCVAFDPEAADCGSYCVPVTASSGEKVALQVYLIDSNGDAKTGGYEPLRPEQLDWYREQRERLCAENGAYVPSIVFQHIPLVEYYDLLKRVKKGTKKAVRAFRKHKNEYYLLDETKVWQSGFFMEPPAAPDENCGEFSALQEKGEVFAVFAGHDHKNSFVGKKDGIDLGYTPGVGFNVYGPGKQRAVRVFEFKEEAPRDYKTYTLSFEKLVGGRLKTPLKDLLFRYAPSSMEAAIAMGIRTLAVTGVAVLLGVLLYWILR